MTSTRPSPANAPELRAHHAPAAPAPPISSPAWRAAHASLVFVWLWTAVVSLWELHGTSQQLLTALAPYPSWVTQGLIIAGAAADLAIGLWLWWRPGRAAYATAATLMGVMTLLATVLAPDLWLHPLGPLSKNLPIAALLWLLWQRTPRAAPARGAPAAASSGSSSAY